MKIEVWCGNCELVVIAAKNHMGSFICPECGSTPARLKEE